MEDDVKSRFDETDKRLASIEKRIDDVKWYMGGVASFYTIVFGVLSLISSLNFNSERASLREFERDLKAELGKVEEVPELAILGENGQELNGQEIPASVDKEKEGNFRISFSWICRNHGSGTTGPIYEKIYTRKPLVFDAKSTDEPESQSELYFSPKDIAPSELPGQYTTSQVTTFYQVAAPPPGKYPLALKMFYGKGRISKSVFAIIIPKT